MEKNYLKLFHLIRVIDRRATGVGEITCDTSSSSIRKQQMVLVC